MHSFERKSKQFITYLLLLIDRWHLEGDLFDLQHICLVTRCNSAWFMVAISSRISRFSFCIMCGRFLYTHSFMYHRRKKSVTLRSGDPTGHGISDTWKCSSSLKTHISHRSIVTEHFWKWYDIISFAVCRLCILPYHRRGKVLSEMCQSALRHSV